MIKIKPVQTKKGQPVVNAGFWLLRKSFNLNIDSPSLLIAHRYPSFRENKPESKWITVTIKWGVQPATAPKGKAQPQQSPFPPSVYSQIFSILWIFLFRAVLDSANGIEYP